MSAPLAPSQAIAPGTIRKRRRHPMLREVPVAIWLLTVVSAVAGACSGCHPVGRGPADVVVDMLFAGAVVLVASQATWPTLLLGAGVAVAVGGPVERGLGIAAVVLVLVLERRGRIEPSGAAVIALVAVQCAMRYPEVEWSRMSAASAALAVVPMLISGVRGSPDRLRRRLGHGGAVVGVVLGIGIAFALVTAVAARQALEHGQDQVLDGLRSAQAGDRDGALEHLRNASVEFSRARSATGGWWAWPSRQLPVIAPQVQALGQVSTRGGDAVTLAYDGADQVDPARLRFVDGTLDLAVIRQYQPIFTDLARRIHALREEADPRSPWLLPPVTDGLDRFDHTMAKADASATTAAQAATLAPLLLGADRPRRYFVMFVTPAEARASGGLMGNEAVLTVDRGHLDLGPIGRLADLNDAGDPAQKKITAPADYVARYGRFDPAHYWENVTMSPDFPSVGQVVSQLFPESGGEPIDGVLRLDPEALRGLLLLTGPVTIPGLAEPIGATNVVPFLLQQQYELFDHDNQSRIDVLGDVGRATFNRLTTGAGANPEQLAAAMGPPVRDQDLALWMADPRLEAFVRRIGAAAAVAPTAGDSFGVVTQNGGASKIDAFLHRTISYDATVDAATGEVTAQASVDLRNAAPAHGLPAYVIGNLVGLPSGTNRSYLSIYSPLQLTGATVDGRPLALDAQRELGRNVYSGFVDIGPGKTLHVRVTLRGRLAMAGGHYRFDDINQVQAVPDHLTWQVRVRGASIEGVGALGLAAGVRHTAHSARVRVDTPSGSWSVDLHLVDRQP